MNLVIPLTMLDESNTAILTMTDPYTGSIESVSVLADNRIISGAIIRFANRYGISASMVEHSVLWPSETASA